MRHKSLIRVVSLFTCRRSPFCPVVGILSEPDYDRDSLDHTARFLKLKVFRADPSFLSLADHLIHGPILILLLRSSYSPRLSVHDRGSRTTGTLLFSFLSLVNLSTCTLSL